ncbi:NUDIX domain-containing protein [uncultured Jatrophihabitans sp.]|uniref:NUDIX domain-containing protein n=1 Tax=uncultured Jatrophihabitans sp. TaxID=1610747 RepID=UPI0035CA005F
MAPRTRLPSAGLLLYRLEPAGLELLLAHMGGPLWASKDDRAWTVPKGEYDDTEDAYAAARREFAEELGSEPPDGDPVPLGEIRQSGGKRVTAWALPGDLDVTTVQSNDFELEWPPRSGRTQTFPEIDRAAWFDPGTARSKLVTAQSAFVDRLEQALAVGNRYGASQTPRPPQEDPR